MSVPPPPPGCRWSAVPTGVGMWTVLLQERRWLVLWRTVDREAAGIAPMWGTTAQACEAMLGRRWQALG